MKVLLTRPTADSEALAASMEAAGHTAIIAPVMEICETRAPLNCEGIAAFALTSRNAVAALVASAALRDLTVYAVGDATAEAIRGAGFADLRVADGDVLSLVDLIKTDQTPSHGRIVHLSGRHRAGDLAGALKAAGLEAETVVAYEAVAAAQLPDEARRALMAGEVDAAPNAVMFYSPRAAATFVSLVRADKDSESLISSLKAITAIAISENTANKLDSDLWRAVVIAPDKTSESMIASLENLRGG